MAPINHLRLSESRQDFLSVEINNAALIRLAGVNVHLGGSCVEGFLQGLSMNGGNEARLLSDGIVIRQNGCYHPSVGIIAGGLYV